MQHLIKNNYIYIPRKNLTAERISQLLHLDFSLTKEGYYKAQDDAVRRSLLGIPLPKINKKPLKVKSKLTKEQQKSAEKMISVGSLLNANQMGLGKTFETIMAIENLGSEKVLIVSPKFVRLSWRNELQKWLQLDPADINIIEGTPKQRKEKAENLKRFNIINYELLRNRKDLAANILAKTQWDTLVIDEAHRIKNRKAQQTKGLNRLKAKHKFALTGTPIQNKPDDLWSILYWIDPFLSGRSYWRFVDNFCEVEEGFFGSKIVGLTKNRHNLEALRTILDYTMTRRLGDAELPERIDIPIKLDMSNKQQKLYKSVKENIIVELEDDEFLLIDSALVRLLRLQQTTSNPQLYDDTIVNPKFEFIKEIGEDNKDQKFLVFSRFKKTIHKLKEELGDRATTLTGDTDDLDHVFKEFEERQFLLATIGAAGEGVDGLQKYSDTVIFIDKNWSPEINNQAVGRLLRRDQKNKVKVYDLQVNNTIDEEVEHILQLKLADIVKALK